MQYVPRWLRNAGVGLALLATGCAGATAGNSGNSTNGLPNLNGVWEAPSMFIWRKINITQDGSYFKGVPVEDSEYLSKNQKVFDGSIEIDRRSGKVYVYCTNYGRVNTPTIKSELRAYGENWRYFECSSSDGSGNYNVRQNLLETQAPDASK